MLWVYVAETHFAEVYQTGDAELVAVQARERVLPLHRGLVTQQ